jgi:phosphopantetheinyl transferase
MLNRTERKYWYGISERGPRRIEWLMGRIAAKDAVRQWAAESLNLSLAPVDVEIRQTHKGKPFAVCRYVKQDIPDLSISHSEGHAIAVLAEPGHSIGIDYLRMEKVDTQGLPEVAFDTQELAHLDAVEPSLREKAIITLWCIKEAAAKAAGTGFSGRPDKWKIEYFSLKDGHASVLYDGKLFPCRFWLTDEFAFSICQH